MNLNFPQKEKRILKFWKDNRIFQKSIGLHKKAPNFVFYEGPPTANAKPGIHHALSRVYKDVICRYKTMRGFKVLRKAGWDTHGLPVELEIEKKLGLKSKKDIEKYGVARFNQQCKKSVWEYKKDWEKLTERIAFWLDLNDPYITYASDYIESVWWIIKQIYQKGLLYQDYKVVPYCARCGTSLSSHEVALGYKSIKEPSIYVKLKLKNENAKLLAWTTTPWTLPGNLAVAVNPEIIYVKAKVKNENLILAKERLSVLGCNYKIIKEFKGKDLIGLEYEPLYAFAKPGKKAWFVIKGDFVSLEEGTGLVHIAPAFGEEDIAVGKENNLPILLNVDEGGKFKKEVKKWAGLWVKDADPLIIEDLKKQKLLFKEELYEHDYPFCWRCGTPLLYYAKQSWFIKTQKIKKDLIKNNKKINWIPAHLKEGRFGEWLKEIKDWAFSRERYWGTPLPIWRCPQCGRLEIVGSLKDLILQRFSTNNYCILRHGHSLRQVKKIAMCWPEKIHCPLTKQGEDEVKLAAKKLKRKRIDIIFSSDLLRTKQTAQIAAEETKAKIIFDKRLREWDVGTFNGKDPKSVWEYLNKKGNLILAKPPRGESLTEIQRRIYSFLKEINSKYESKNILIVSHELPLTILEWTLKGRPLERLLEDRKEKKLKIIGTSQFREVKFKSLPYNNKMELDLHRPFIDEVRFFCPECKKESIMERVPEVIDCWFDSGAMPFAQYHYPFENQKLQKEQFPADYISEAIDQTRGWFYTLHAISALLGKGLAYKNVISVGHVLDEKGEKMSKSKGNVVDPWYIIEKYGADATRWYFYTINQPGDAKLFSEKDVDQALKKFILTFWNCLMFYGTYAQQKNISVNQPIYQRKSAVLLDKWIVSKLNNLIKEVTQKLDKYDVTGAARNIESFVINDLSLWYIRRSRKRFQKPETKNELEEASATLNYALVILSRLVAPFIPFLSEEISRKAGNKKSIHLESWPKADKKMIDEKLDQKMEEARAIVTQALAERAKAGIKVRQPLASLQIPKSKSQIPNQLLDLIKEEVNVKEITFGKILKLNTKITPELKEEGTVREVMRNIQEMRKKANLKPKDKIKVWYSGTVELNKVLARNKKVILKEAKVKDFILAERSGQVFDAEREINIGQEKLQLTIKKL